MEVESTSNMLVAVRIRPLSRGEMESGQKSCCQTIGGKVVTIKKNGDGTGYLKSQQPIINEYAFDEVFDDSVDQVGVYSKTAKLFIPHLLEGQNVTVFAYGATGAGKTHTMLGNTRADSTAAHSEAGIIPNSVQDLFALLQRRKRQSSYGESYKVLVSFLEVYNEQVYDLLESSGKILSVREDKDKGIVVAAGLTEMEADNYEQVHELILQGNKQRKTEATMANQVSSRSHAILQLSIRHIQRVEGGREALTESKLSLIDLAGSERASATNNRGARLQEGANINKSLLALANCINALSENANNKKSGNVKYRDSKLTHLLKSSLEGNGYLVMIANVNPSDLTYEDSHNTLKYANRAKNIKVNPLAKEVQVKETNWVEREMKLREENSHLKNVIHKLESQVMELRKFKESVMANGGVAPLSSMNSYDSFSVITQPPRHEEVQDGNDFDLSTSSLSTAVDTVSGFISPSEESFPQSSHPVTNDVHMPLKSGSPAFIPVPKSINKILESSKPSMRNPFDFVHEERDEVETAMESDTAQPITGTKRRASLLPSYKGSVKVSRRHSLDLKASSAKMDSVVSSISSADSKQPDFVSSTQPDNPIEPEVVTSTSLHIVLPQSDAASLNQPTVAWPDSKVDFDIGQSAVITQQTTSNRRVSMRMSTSAISRRKSIAQVTALLDSLQQDVTSSLTSLSAPSNKVVGDTKIDVKSKSNHVPEEEVESIELPLQITRSKVLQVVNSNIVQELIAHDVDEKSSTLAKRKSYAVKKIKASAPDKSADREDVIGFNKENQEQNTGLRRSKRRASVSLIALV